MLRSGVDKLVVSDNIHELRAYNRLALLSQATAIIMMQDDHVQQHGARHWVAMGMAMHDVWAVAVPAACVT